MSTTSAAWTCAKCGRTGLTSVTYIGGLATCGYCYQEIVRPTGIPENGPGSHAWDLSVRRAEAAEAKLAEAERKLRELPVKEAGEVASAVARAAAAEARVEALKKALTEMRAVVEAVRAVGTRGHWDAPRWNLIVPRREAEALFDLTYDKDAQACAALAAGKEGP